MSDVKGKFISHSGADANAGTLAAPYRSWQKLFDSLDGTNYDTGYFIADEDYVFDRVAAPVGYEIALGSFRQTVGVVDVSWIGKYLYFAATDAYHTHYAYLITGIDVGNNEIDVSPNFLGTRVGSTTGYVCTDLSTAVEFDADASASDLAENIFFRLKSWPSVGNNRATILHDYDSGAHPFLNVSAGDFFVLEDIIFDANDVRTLNPILYVPDASNVSLCVVKGCDFLNGGYINTAVITGGSVWLHPDVLTFIDNYFHNVLNVNLTVENCATSYIGYNHFSSGTYGTSGNTTPISVNGSSSLLEHNIMEDFTATRDSTHISFQGIYSEIIDNLVIRNNTICNFSSVSGSGGDPYCNGIMLNGGADSVATLVYNNIIAAATSDFSFGIRRLSGATANVFNNCVYNCATRYSSINEYSGDLNEDPLLDAQFVPQNRNCFKQAYKTRRSHQQFMGAMPMPYQNDLYSRAQLQAVARRARGYL